MLLFLDWAKILSNNLATAILSYRSKRTISRRIYPPFYLSAYVMDAICYISKFPLMGWKWTTQDPLPIHIYHKELWDSKFTLYFYNICHGIMLPLYKCCMIKTLQDFLPKQRSIFSTLRDGSENNFSHMSGYSEVLLPLMYYLYMFLINY